MKAITRLFRMWWLRREVRIWDQMIEDERRHYATHADRLRSMYWQRSPHKAELDRLEGVTSVLYTQSRVSQNVVRRQLERMKQQ